MLGKINKIKILEEEVERLAKEITEVSDNKALEKSNGKVLNGQPDLNNNHNIKEMLILNVENTKE